MKYIFFGTPRFAEIILGELIHAGMPPTALVCNPDRPVGRKKIVTAPPTKMLAKEYGSERRGIDIIQPEKWNDAALRQLDAYQPDFFVVAAYAKILPQEALDIPGLGTLGVHPSFLPKYRGASPIQSAILNGETTTGATIYLMDEKTDHGPVLSQKIFDFQFPIFTLPYPELEEKLAQLSAKLLIKTIPDFVTGKIAPEAQDESRATYTKKFKTEDGFVDGNDLAAAESGDEKKANEILKKINAMNPEPGAWTKTNSGKRVKLLKAKISDGHLALLETQREGERAKPFGANH